MSEFCTVCDGDGIYNGVDCPHCGGTGIYIANIPGRAIPSYKVLEALDTAEYNALTDEQKNGVSILLSCGEVDLNEGKVGRVRLWNWFGAESTTVANLTGLLI